MNNEWTKKAVKVIIKGEAIEKELAMKLAEQPVSCLEEAADQVRRMRMGSGFDLCTIINGKSGRCPEDCRYCAQSAHYNTGIAEYPLLSPAQIVEAAKRNFEQGVMRFSIVTSGRALSDSEVDAVCRCYEKIRDCCEIQLCASHGLLTLSQLQKLKQAGVSRYHCNLETSRRYFPSVCSTHSYDDKLATIENAKKAGLSICSGGIIGMGETMEDRIDLALELRTLLVRSVPINVLSPIAGTPFAALAPLSEEEVIKTIALFRLLLPDAAIRMAGGRGALPEYGRRAFCAGANAAISGDMLTTCGITVKADRAMLHKLGFEVRI